MTRHIRNCLKAEPAYGKGVADALGFTISDLPVGDVESTTVVQGDAYPEKIQKRFRYQLKGECSCRKAHLGEVSVSVWPKRLKERNLPEKEHPDAGVAGGFFMIKPGAPTRSTDANVNSPACCTSYD